MSFATDETWSFKVLRTTGIQHLRPEKAWRPIVTIQLAAEGEEDCDASSCHELNLGCDGQNPNQKDIIQIRDATLRSKLSVKVWHRSQTKKRTRTRKRNLVAYSSLTFADLWKKQSAAGASPFELRLSALSNGKTGTGNRLGVCPTLSVKMTRPSEPVIEENMPDADTLPYPLETLCEDLSLPPSTPERDVIILPPLNEDELRQLLLPYTCEWDDNSSINTPIDAYSLAEVPAILPQYSQPVPSTSHSPMGVLERFVSMFTLYSELRSAQLGLPEQFEPIFRQQLSEWTYVCGFLIALGGVDVAVFAIPSDSFSDVAPAARFLVAASSSASGIGIVCAGWFMLRFSFAPTAVVSTRARDVFDSYFFFALSARMPMACMMISGGALMVFLVIVAWGASREGVLVVSAFVGMMLTLQFLVWGFWKLGVVVGRVASVIGLVWLAKRIMRIGRMQETSALA